MKESCHTYEGVMSHIWRSHVTHMNEACHRYVCENVYTHVYINTNMLRSVRRREELGLFEWVSHINESWHSQKWVMELCEWVMELYTWVMELCEWVMYTCVYIDTIWWLRLVGSLKWQVSFAEYNLFYRALLRKGPVILRSLHIEGPP